MFAPVVDLALKPHVSGLPPVADGRERLAGITAVRLPEIEDDRGRRGMEAKSRGERNLAVGPAVIQPSGEKHAVRLH